MVEKQQKNEVCVRTVCLSVWCVENGWNREKGGSRVLSGMEGGLDGQVWNPEVKAEISGLYPWT